MLSVTFLVRAAIYIEAAERGECYEESGSAASVLRTNDGHISVRAQLPELSDWSLKDIGIFRQVPGLDAVKPFWMA